MYIVEEKDWDATFVRYIHDFSVTILIVTSQVNQTALRPRSPRKLNHGDIVVFGIGAASGFLGGYLVRSRSRRLLTRLKNASFRNTYPIPYVIHWYHSTSVPNVISWLAAIII